MSKPLRPKSEWHEDMGDVLWWSIPHGQSHPDEPPYVGSPLDTGYRIGAVLIGPTGEEETCSMFVGGWSGYHNYFQELDVPEIEPES